MVDINEEGKVISYYDEYYVVQTQGTVDVFNGYNASMYQIMLPVKLDYLTLFETSSTDYWKHNHFYFLEFKPYETKTFDYEIRGVTPKDPMYLNMSVLRTAMFNRTPAVYSTLISRIQKMPIEAVDVNTSRIRSVKNRRIITVSLENPSDTKYYNISSIKVIKTSSENITNEIKRWTYPEDVPYVWLGPFETWKKDIVDYNCTEGEVYWLSSEIDLEIFSYVNGTHRVLRFDQEDLNLINKTLNESEIEGNISAYLEHLLFVKKSYSNTHLLPEDIITADIRINNFAPINRTVYVTDFIPYGFKVLDDCNATEKTDSDISWSLVVNPDSSASIRYKMEYVDYDTLGLDYFEPAIIRYKNNTFYTQRTSFVRQYIPEKKVFIQKKIRSSINDEFVVTVMLQNLGETSLENIHVKEFLEAGDQFREITIVPASKGLWEIPKLEKDESWEVSYVTNDNLALTTLPAVLGIENNVVLKTLVFENTIKNEWVHSTVHMIEKIGVGLLIALPLLLIVMNRRRRMKKESTLRGLGKRISRLKQDSMPNPNDSIDLLKRETALHKEFPDLPKTERTGLLKGISSNNYDKDANKAEAHKNLEQLKDLHDEIGHDKDNR
ncbi:hypothetical protein JXB31_05205 [Candidatus Woesearchaeota archaeon]|nr:hypothetical protein [Candidatus Woesearchaeota archaeon]